MNEIQNKYIQHLKTKMSLIKINYGIEAYKDMLQKYIIDKNNYNSITLSTFFDATFMYFDSHFNIEDASKLKDIVKKDIEELERKSQENIQKKYKLSKFILRWSYINLYKIKHNEILKAKIEDEKLYLTYQEILDITNETNKILIHFDQLAKDLESSNFSIQNLSEIILYFIQLNLKHFNESEISPIADYEKIRNHEFEYISKTQIEELLENGTLTQFLSCECNKNKEKRQELNEFIRQNPFDISSIIENCKIISDNYTQVNELSEENITIIHNALIGLKIDPQLCIKMSVNLNKKMKKLKQEQKQITSQRTIKTPKSTLSKKEIYLISKELEQYFDFKKHKAIKMLSLNEIIYCISLLEKLSADSKTIDEFLQLIQKENKKENPIYLYVDLYHKLMAYKNADQMITILANIEQQLQKMFICSDEEYEQIKLNVAENIKYALNIIGNNYEYEKKEAEKIKCLTNKIQK